MILRSYTLMIGHRALTHESQKPGTNVISDDTKGILVLYQLSIYVDRYYIELPCPIFHTL